MTLEEFEKRLRMQAQYQGSQAQKQDNEQNLRVINQRGDTSPIKRQISVVNKTQETPKEAFNNKLASTNKDVKAAMRAPISSTIERTTGISAENANPKKTIINDLGNVSKNLWIGAKQGGLNFVNGLAKIGNVVSDKVFNREEKTKQALDEDLKRFGVDGTGLTIEEKAKKLIEIDPLSLDKYSELLTAGPIRYNGDGIDSKIGNAISAVGDDSNLFLAPYEDLINGTTLTENEEGNYVSDSWFGNRDVENIDNKVKQLGEEANKNTEKVNSSVLKYIAGLSPSIGNNASSLISETLLPGTGTLYFTGSAINSYALDGKERGLSDDASLLYGATLGIVDGQLERVGLSTLTKAGKNMLKGSTKQALKNYTISIIDNYIQEALMEPAQETANQIFTGESDWNNMLGRAHEAGVAGAVSSTILGGASAGMSKGINVASNLSNNQQNTLKTEIIEKINKNNLLEDSVKNTLLNSLNNLNNKSLTTLNQELNTIDEVITQIQKADISEVIENRKNVDKNTTIKQNYAKYKNAALDKRVVNTAMELVETNKQNKRTKEQWLKVAEQIGNNITSQEAEMYAYKTWMDMKPNNKENLNRQGKSYVQFTLDEWVNKVKEASNKVQDANIQKNAPSVMQDASMQVTTKNMISPVNNETNSSSSKNYYESAKKHNIDVNNSAVKAIYNLANKRGINVRYDDSIFNDTNQSAIWKRNQDGSREIILNPKATTNRALQTIMLHEIVHDMEGTTEYNELRKIVLDYAKKQKNYDNARKNLEDMYSSVYDKNSNDFESLIDQEVVADILGEKLGDQEFINSLVKQNRNVAQKIYDWVIDKLNSFSQAIGFNNEYLYWKNVENKFRNAFNSEFNNIEGGTKFSIQTNTNGNKYIKVDTDQDIFEGIAPKDYSKIAKMYMQDYLMGETKLSNDDTAVIDRRGINKYTNPGKFQFNFNEKMKLTPELKNALNISEKVSAKSPIKSNSKYSNWEYYNFNFEINGNKFSGLINIGIDSNNNKHFYEINNIKRIGVSETSLKESTNPSINNIIPQTQKNINGGIKNDISTKDNKGRQLSAQQQEYFKDSKVRDENGNLIEVYHASKNKFTKFDKSKIRTGITLYSNNGDGFYFTDSKGMVDDYIQNGEVYSVYLNITKPFTVENNLSDEAKNVLVDFSKQTYYNHQEEESKKRFGRYEIFDADDIGQRSGSAILSRVVSAYGDEFTQFLKDKGYDGIKASVTDYHNTGSKYDYIAFEPNQIKNVDNVNPTASDDIRYSKSSDSEYQKFLQDNFSNDGTKTYMEDIKLPSKIANLKDELRSIVDKSKDMDSDMKDSLIELINNTDDEKELQSYKESLQPKAPVKSGTIKITNYKNAKLNSKVVNNALSMIEANKQGKRTKTQWLQVAEQIGMNIKENEIDKYAYKTWSEFLPNQKDNLNRQGEKYVKFTRDEWIKAVQDGYKKGNDKNNSRTNDYQVVGTNIVYNLEEGIKRFKSNNYNNNEYIKILDNIPEQFYNLGFKLNQPLVINMKKLSSITAEPKGTVNGKNQHGIKIETLKQLGESLKNPLNIIRNMKYNNRYVVVTELTDQYGDIIIVPLEINSNGNIEKISKINSIYGKENYDYPSENNLKKYNELKGYMEQNRDNIVYDIDENNKIKGSSSTENRLQLLSLDRTTSINNIIPSEQNYVNNRENRNISPTAKTNKVMNPVEIANLTEKDASSTPIAPTRNYGKGNKESRFYRNVTSNSKFLNRELRQELKNEDDVRFYQGVTNEESLTNALKKLNDGGENETLSWFNKDSFDAEDVAEGWILMKRYQDAGDYRGVVEVIKKMRNQGTTAGQTIQAFNIMNRLTPEGMVNYAQGELSEAFEKMSKNKTKEWIDANREKFELTPEETAFIMNNIQEAQTLESDSRERAIKLGEIQKVMKDKLPPDKGAGIKAWMRISMLFNPKTQVRNVAGNAIIAPVNAVSDIVSAGVDKVLSKKTGVRTTGVPNLKAMLKGAGKGLYNSYDDFKRDINTRNMTGNRYEFNEGDKKSFNTNTSVGKGLYQVERLLSFMLDAGDRVFYEASFVNSINNQKVLNNSNEVTQDMIDIATNDYTINKINREV